MKMVDPLKCPLLGNLTTIWLCCQGLRAPTIGTPMSYSEDTGLVYIPTNIWPLDLQPTGPGKYGEEQLEYRLPRGRWMATDDTGWWY